jgi:hypothetical protein
MLTKPPPAAFWAYLCLSALVVAVGIFELTSLTVQFPIWLSLLWGSLILGIAARMRQARYVLIAWQVLAFVQVTLALMAGKPSAGSIVLMLLMSGQLAVLFAPSFRSNPSV